MARFAVPVPEWLPVEEPSFISFDDVGSIFAGEPYNVRENMDPYPEFCWTSKRVIQDTVDVDIDTTFSAQLTSSQSLMLSQDS